MAQIGTSPARLEWLRGELARWREDGLVTHETAEAILGRYVAVRRLSIVRVVAGIGAAFIVAGLVWLVAANLDELGPWGRVLLVGSIWLVVTALAAWLAHRRELAGDLHSPLVGALWLIAAGAFGAVVYLGGDLAGVEMDGTVWWVGVWAVGALVYGYLCDSVPPTVLGVGLLAIWYAARSGMLVDTLHATTAGVLVAGAIGLLVAAVHPAGTWARHGVVWTAVGGAALLVGTFLAGVPFHRDVGRGWPWLVLVGLVVAVGLAVVAVRRAGLDRLQAWGTLGVLVLALALSFWEVDDRFEVRSADAMTWARAAVSVVVFLVVASSVMALGVRRDLPILTVLAAIGLVVFVTFQAFAVFVDLLNGASLFLAVGVVLVGTALLVDRGRRRLTSELAEAVTPAAG